MAQFRRIPVLVEAMTAGQIRDLSHRERPAWVQAALQSGRLVLKTTELLVRSPAQDFSARRVDWIVQDADGELSAWRPAAFANNFQPA